jgi:hypothetical protein
VKNKKSLQSSAVVCKLPDAIQAEIDDLLPDWIKNQEILIIEYRSMETPESF